MATRFERFGYLLLATGAALTGAWLLAGIIEPPATRNCAIDVSDPADSLLATAMPRWDKREVHAREADGAPGEVWQRLMTARTDTLPLTKLLMRVRAGGRDAVPDGTIVSALPPRIIAQTPARELLLGLYYPSALSSAQIAAARRLPMDELLPRDMRALQRFNRPGWSKLVMNFRIDPLSAGADGTARSRVTTETRVLSCDTAARRAFARYWLLIRAGSGLIRREILAAVAG